MNRRTYLKRTALMGGVLLLPLGAMSLVGRHSNAVHKDLPGFAGKIMGTGYSVKLGTEQSVATADLASGAHGVLQQVDALMSTWRTDSELSAINRAAADQWSAVSPATYRVLKAALEISTLSAGSFDTTVGPLVDLWGFGAGASESINDRPIAPASKVIDQVRARVNYQHIQIDSATLSVRKQAQDVQLDFSGIAKGYAVDQLADFVERSGFNNYLVEVGGELRSGGSKPDGTAWRVAIERPSTIGAGAFRVIQLNNSAVATSGDYRHYFTDGSKHYSHSIDPRTGFPTDHELASVSVVASSAMLADAYSTALMIMGPEQALAFADANDVSAHFILRSKSGKLGEQYSRGFHQYMELS